MGTLLVAAIVVLLLIQVRGTVEGGRTHHHKQTPEERAFLEWTLAGMARGRQDGDSQSKYDDFYNCVNGYGATDDDMEEYFGNPTAANSSQVLQCIAGCYFEWAKLIVDHDLDRERMEGLLQVFGVKHDDAGHAALDCQEHIADVPRETCELGAAVDGCLRNLLAAADALNARTSKGGKRLDPGSATSRASQRKDKHHSRRSR